MGIKKDMFRALVHIAFQPGKAKDRILRKYCSDIRGKKVLEIGSGKAVRGKYAYSVADFFEKRGNKVTKSDVNPAYKHKIIDITKEIPGKYDAIICFNVLEHVFDFQKGIRQLHKSLDKNGRLIVLVPAFYPLHDEPHDYWRFTEHSLRKLFSIFKTLKIEHYGKRELPFFYFVVAVK
ncbi:methyltransferase domain-containing protein [Candidatus Woesearchaeota archaeon]|nr:methyltransferase domain-containing protein [Candidatus Woesearchaeota archaeon]